jgi:hypothetical protein
MANKNTIRRMVPKSNRKIVNICKIDTSNTHIHGRSLSSLAINTSIKSGGIKPNFGILISS